MLSNKFYINTINSKLQKYCGREDGGAKGLGERLRMPPSRYYTAIAIVNS